MRAAAMLKRARRHAGLSQRALAARTGILQPAIARIEAGAVVPRVDTLERLLAACGQGLQAEALPGEGIDRTVIRELLRLSPRQRLEVAVAEAANLAHLLDVAGSR